MKILIVGAWRWPQYEEAFARGLREGGTEVSGLAASDFFPGRLGRIEQGLALPGPATFKLNRAVLDAALTHRPAWVLFWRPTEVFARTLRSLSRSGVRVASYNNDDPFGPRAHGNVPWHHHLLWRRYIGNLRHFDANFFYRPINCAEAQAAGARHAQVLLPYFLPWRDRPVALSEEEHRRYGADVVFAGHYEDDGRAEAIRALVAAGLRVSVRGGSYWTRAVLREAYDTLAPITPADGDEYTKVLCGAKVCLCFLSKLNRDSYTRRCFEIPACRGVLLAERTPELLRFFKEDEEACYFSSVEELVRKVRWLSTDADARERIAAAGLRRVWADGHSVQARAKDFVDRLRALQGDSAPESTAPAMSAHGARAREGWGR